MCKQKINKKRFIIKVIILVFVIVFCLVQNQYLTVTFYSYKNAKIPKEF